MNGVDKEFVKKIKEWEKSMVKEYGYYIHAIPAKIYKRIYPNYHTHGLEEKWGHLDFQIVAPISIEEAGIILNKMALSVKNGAFYNEGEITMDEIHAFLIKKKDLAHDVLRIILPDPLGRFKYDAKCDMIFSAQDEIDTTEG